MRRLWIRWAWRLRDWLNQYLTEIPPEAAGLPHPLRKANGDPFDYMVGLRDGTMIRFGELTWERVGGTTWVTFGAADDPLPVFFSRRWAVPAKRPIFDRGLCVRLQDVLWCADAPYGI